MDPTATLIIIGLALAWGIQYALAFWQMKRFYRRVAELRRDGQVSIGMAGSSWRRRQYAVLVVDANHRIVHVSQLSGWTIFATLKPVPGLDGRPMSDLFEDGAVLPVGNKLLLALRNAADYVKAASAKQAARSRAAGNTLEQPAGA